MNDHLLYLHLVTVNKAEHIDAWHLVEADLGVTAEGFAIEYTPHHADDLQGGLAFVQDDEFSIAEERKGL